MTVKAEGGDESIGQLLRKARTAKRFTLRFVEQKTGISNAYLSQLETGKITNPSSRILRKLAELYGISYKLGYLSKPTLTRDVFISHRASDKVYVRELAADIESESYEDRQLYVWLDEAEIRPGDSVPKMLNEGLENSRFIALVLTPSYFHSESGWTDAEWHAALHSDPDNRKGRLIPLLVEDCPYIPYLLRHLRAIDLRGQRYERGVRELLAILKGEPLPRPVTHRGQLITSGSRVDRSTLVAERAVPDADPDVVTERLYCNLLPVERLPQFVYSASIRRGFATMRARGATVLPSKSRLKDAIRLDQEERNIEADKRFMPAFRLFQDRILTFHDLEDPENPLSSVIDDEEIDVIDVRSFSTDEDQRKTLISLLNMALARHLHRAGLVIDNGRQSRYFFPPADGRSREISWIPFKKRAVRTVAKPVVKDGKVIYWRHLGAYLKTAFIANKFYVQISPTWVITHDGITPGGGATVTKRVAKWTGPERNLQVLYHVRFWTNVLRANRRGPITIWAGDQHVEIATVPAIIQLSYGIASDQKSLLKLLDQEAPLIAAEEDELADIALENDEADQELEEASLYEGEDNDDDESEGEL